MAAQRLLQLLACPVTKQQPLCGRERERERERVERERERWDERERRQACWGSRGWREELLRGWLHDLFLLLQAAGPRWAGVGDDLPASHLHVRGCQGWHPQHDSSRRDRSAQPRCHRLRQQRRVNGAAPTLPAVHGVSLSAPTPSWLAHTDTLFVRHGAPTRLKLCIINLPEPQPLNRAKAQARAWWQGIPGRPGRTHTSSATIALSWALPRRGAAETP